MERLDLTPAFFAPAQVLCIDPGGGRATSAETRARCDAARRVVQKLPAYRAAHAAKEAAVGVVDDVLHVAFFTREAPVVSCAVAFAETWVAAGHTGHRVGIHAGPVSRDEDLRAGAPVEGPGVAVARAVMECGDPGDILVSETVVADPPDGRHIASLGPVEVAPGLRLNLSIVAPSDARAPPTPTRVTQLRDSRAARLASASLPDPPGRFVGREAELSHIAEALVATRLVSLVGPAGIGKTRIAIEAAACLGAASPDGPWFADLSAALAPADIG